MAKVPLSKSMRDQLVLGGFQNVVWPVMPDESTENPSAVYISCREYDSPTATIQDQYKIGVWQCMIRGKRQDGYMSGFEVADNVLQYLINLPARFTINGYEYSNPEILNGPTHIKDDNDRDVFVMNLQTYYNPLES